MQLQVTGQLVGMEPRNGGWVAVVVQDPGSNYPVKMSTKQPALLGQAQQLMMQTVTALYTETPSNNINPNTGEPYTNRNLNQLTLANGAAPQGMPVQPTQTFNPQPVVQQTPTYTPTPAPAARVSDSEREARIHRQTASKVVALMLPLLDKEEQNMASALRLAEEWVHYYVNGVNWQVPAPVPSPTPVGDFQPQTPDMPFTPQPTQEEQLQAAFPAQSQNEGEGDGIPF